MTDERKNGIRNTPESSNMEEDDVNNPFEVSEDMNTLSSNLERCDQCESEDMEASDGRIGSKAEVDDFSDNDSKMLKSTDSMDIGEHVQKEADVSSTPAYASSSQTSTHGDQYSCSLGQENELLNQEVCSNSDPYKSNPSDLEVLERNPMAANSAKELQPVNKSSESEKDLKNILFSSGICVKPEKQMCENSADVQNCRVYIDENQSRNQNVHHSNYVGRKPDEQNEITENQAGIKEDNETIENNRYKMQQPTVDKEHLQSSSDISKTDTNIENSKDKGQELYTHTKIQYKATNTLTDSDERVENSKNNVQELCTGTKTDCKATGTETDYAVNTLENDEKAKAALAKARRWNTCDDEEYDMVYDYKKDEGFIKACEKYVYFWRNKDIYSQWHKSTFIVNDKTFNCAEQYMMYKKAELFEDTKIAKKILSEKSPRDIKSLGRQVRNFSEEIWAANCLYIVKQANIAKFSQDEHLKKELFATYPKLLVEASPHDKIWGIGLAEDDCKAWYERKWRGKNLLGYILTEVRDELMCDAGKIQKHEKQEYLEFLMEVQKQEAHRLNKEKEMKPEVQQHRQSGNEEHKPSSKGAEQSDKTVNGKTELSFNETKNPYSKEQDELLNKHPPLKKDNTKPKEDKRSETETAMESENYSEKIKHENDSLRQTSSEGGKVEDKRENIEHYSTRRQASDDDQCKGLQRAIENPVTDVDKSTISSADTVFHSEQRKKPSSCQQEKQTVVKDGKCDGNKDTSPVPLCNSLQRKESFGRQGDKETVDKEDGCDGNIDMSAGLELSSEQDMETLRQQGDKRPLVKENECQRNIENKQDGMTNDEEKSLEFV